MADNLPARDPSAPVRNPVGFPGVLGLIAASGWLIWQSITGLAAGPDGPAAWFSIAMSGSVGIGFLFPAWTWIRGYTIRIDSKGLAFLGPFGRPMLVPWDRIGEVRIRTYPIQSMAGLVRRLELRWTRGRLVVPPTVDLTDAWERVERQLVPGTHVNEDGKQRVVNGEPEQAPGD